MAKTTIPLKVKPRSGQEQRPFSLFCLAFRPFFLAGALSAIILIALWLMALFSDIAISGYLSPRVWHGHEMIFGFGGAIVAGFILTAVQTWTGIRSIHGRALMLLFGLWVLARLLLAFASPSFFFAAAIIDLSFIPLAMWHLGRLIIRARQIRNMVFLPVLSLLLVANLAVHLEALGYTSTAMTGLKLGLWCLILMIVLIGGRVIPVFTKNRISGLSIFSHPLLEIACIIAVVLLAAGDLLGQPHWVPWLATLCALLHGIRLWGWRPHKTTRVPLLWVLHAGYAWVVLGFLLMALRDILLIPTSLALHAFAVGGMGTIILGMISRVSLGHTARPLEPSRWIIAAFWLINLAALLRVVFPLLMPQNWSHSILFAGIAWSIAFGLFLVVYIPILTQPRLDGKEG